VASSSQPQTHVYDTIYFTHPIAEEAAADISIQAPAAMAIMVAAACGPESSILESRLRRDEDPVFRPDFRVEEFTDRAASTSACFEASHDALCYSNATWSRRATPYQK
jgi:hypothetical protein